MESLYNAAEAGEWIKRYDAYPKELALRVYTSRLLGSNPNLVLHGGGNTSVKLKIRNIFNEKIDVVFVKGSGLDLATIEPKGFVGLRLNALRKLMGLETLSDIEMNNQLNIQRIDARSPNPSVEALLHAFLPGKYIDHTHADSILVLTHQKNGAEIVKEALGPKIAVIPYTMSGLPLAKIVLERYEDQPDIEAIVILNHGIFTFAENAEKAYENMIKYVGRAEAYIQAQIHDKPLIEPNADRKVPLENYNSILARFNSALRGTCARVDSEGRLNRFYVETRNAPFLIEASLSQHAQAVCHTGVLTPDHVIRTKNAIVYIESVPSNDSALRQILSQTVAEFIKAYEKYFYCHVNASSTDCRMLNPHPSLFLVAGLGLIAIGSTRKEARIAADIGEHTVHAKLQAFALGDYQPISDSHVFDMEYWSLQQNKLDSNPRLALQGQIAVVTGGGGAIGFGIAEKLLSAGAVVVIADIDKLRLEKVHAVLAEKYGAGRVERIVFDVTDFRSVEMAFEEISCRLGGVDIVVPNAGIAYVARIEDMDPDKLDQVIAVNLKGTFTVIKASIPVFKRQTTGGNIVVISSKNVFDPGAAFGAYSASKAGAHQMSKIAALELAELGVRVNMINPDAVFGDENVSSRLWDLVGPDRMKSRGLDAEGLKEYYCRRSLLKVPVLAEHVGNAVVFFAGNQTPTTGATLPVDAGNPGAFPR
ncbi:MAG: bifunctional aldolase/short-chain dehydrogenase [Desulfobacterales bacterium]|nr:bifunctional aldolase/short-chain dehydrogenase [Desulfobacterales bacterium]